MRLEEVSKKILDTANKRVDREVIVVVSLKGSPKKGRSNIQVIGWRVCGGALVKANVLGSLKTR